MNDKFNLEDVDGCVKCVYCKALQLCESCEKLEKEKREIRKALIGIMNHPGFEMLGKQGYDIQNEECWKDAEEILKKI